MPPQLSLEHRDYLAKLWKQSVHGSQLCAAYVPSEKLFKQDRITRLPREFEALDETEKLKVYRFGFETGVDKLVRLDVRRLPEDAQMAEAGTEPADQRFSTGNKGVEKGNADRQIF